MESLLQQGINAAKTGDKARAFQALTKATQDRTTAEQAWLWLAGVVTDDAERLFCLDNALRINPNNGPAKSKATEYRQKGILPATPTPPRTSPPVDMPPAQMVAPQSIKPSQPIQKDSKPLQPKVTEQPRVNASIQQDLSRLYQFTAMELANKQSPKAVTQKLTAQGVTADVAGRIVSETQKVLKKALVEKNKKRMTRGIIWLVIGIVITCGSLAFASSQGGGRYVLFYGAIIWGFIDFLAGLIGWLSNR